MAKTVISTRIFVTAALMGLLVVACGLNDNVDVVVQNEQSDTHDVLPETEVLEKKAQQFIDALIKRDPNAIVSTLSPSLVERIDAFGGIDLFIEREFAKLEASLNGFVSVGTHVQVRDVDFDKVLNVLSIEISINDVVIPKRWFMTDEGNGFRFVFQKPRSNIVRADEDDFHTYIGALDQSNYVIWNYKSTAVSTGYCGTNSYGNGGKNFIAYGDDPNTSPDYRSTTVNNCNNTCPSWFDGAYFRIPMGHPANYTQPCDWNSYGPDVKIYANDDWYCVGSC